MKTYLILNKTISDPMTYFEFLQKRYRLKAEGNEVLLSTNIIINRCLDVILCEDGKLEINIDGFEKRFLMAPHYKIAFETLISAGILEEIKS